MNKHLDEYRFDLIDFIKNKYDLKTILLRFKMKRVIIIGASYAGLYAVKRFSKYKNIEVILLNFRT